MTKNDLHDALKHYFGFEAFKRHQEEITTSMINKENTFIIMPTGGGESLCYQLPALVLEGTAIMISPLIALTKNQVDAIRGISSTDSITHILNSSLAGNEIREVMEDISNGKTKLLYVVPESLIKEEYASFLRAVPISFVAVDEAHCIPEWGHDFRPEYRNIKTTIERSGSNIPIVALTATATPKVQEDIPKNLGMLEANVFKSSFNCPSLYYGVRPKTKSVDADIIRFVKQNTEKSGTIYCFSREKVEDFAQTLRVNGISAISYHAGLGAKTRAKHRDMFLVEEVDVVIATIAFGMGIDKPDVRFIIHHDVSKSIESYYQEAEHAGRDGGEGHYLAFYSYRDAKRLEKFMIGKPIAEQEIGQALPQDIVAYTETSSLRHKFILHYFGEEFNEVNGESANMDDNVHFPKEKEKAKDDVIKLLNMIIATKQRFKTKEIINTLIGKVSALIKAHRIDEQDFFGMSEDKEDVYWMALLRQVMVNGLTRKDIETYGAVFITEKGKEYLKNVAPFMMTEDHIFEGEPEDPNSGSTSVADSVLLEMLKDLRKKVAKQKGVSPFVIFQDPSLEDMALKYPTTIQKLTNVHGIGGGKTGKSGAEFIKLVERYVEKNDIVRAEDLIVETTDSSSSLRLFVIQSIDRRLPLPDTAKTKGLEVDEFLKKMEQIIYSGTKLNIDYWVNEIFDEEQQEELHEYFMETDSDEVSIASKEFGGGYEDDELRIYRLKLISEVAN